MAAQRQDTRKPPAPLPTAQKRVPFVDYSLQAARLSGFLKGGLGAPERIADNAPTLFLAPPRNYCRAFKHLRPGPDLRTRR